MTQELALAVLKTGANVFLTGEPGSGKTHTINQYVAYLREHGIDPAITASTGIAATHIGGMTVHSWSGIGISKILTEEDLDRLSTNERLTKRVKRASVLIIDEISMLDANTLSAVDTACKTLRRNSEPFGGLQIIFVGDFFQLPPVSRSDEPQAQFAFMSPVWAESRPIVCYITEQHRQEDEEYLKFLSSIRKGDIDDWAHEALSSRKVEPEKLNSHTRLYSHNIDVDKVNISKLESLDGGVRKYVMETIGPEHLVMSLKRGCLSPENLELKLGARVMFTKNNFDEGYVNGTLGEVVGFGSEDLPIVQTISGLKISVTASEWVMTDGSKTLAKIIQLPLRLAWAITVHKSQGMTLDSAVVDLSRSFEYGQGYVALSRVRSFSGLFLLGYNERSLQVHPEILSLDATLRDSSSETEEVFGKLEKEKLQKMWGNFIKACGGSLEKVKAKKVKGPGRAKRARGESTYDITLSLWKSGKRVEEIAKEREITKETVARHLEELYMRKKIEKEDLAYLISKKAEENREKILEKFKELGYEKLSPVFEALGEKYSYDDLRLIRLLYT